MRKLAASAGRVTLASAFLVSVLACTLSGCSSETELHHAARNGDVAAVKQWIARGKTVDVLYDTPGTLEAPGTDGITPLMLAAQNGHPDIVKLLVSAGANAYLQSSRPGYERSARNVFDYAVERGDPGLVRFLWEASDKKTFTGRVQENLSIAVYNSCSREKRPAQRELVIFLIENLANNKLASEALEGISDREYCIDQIRFLLDRGIAPAPNAVVTASSLGLSEIVSLYIERGADLDGLGSSPHAPLGKMTPLFAAAWGAHLETVEMLLSAGAAPDVRETMFGRTALLAMVADGGCPKAHPSCEARHNVVKILLKYGARTDIRDTFGKTALDYVDQYPGDPYVKAILTQSQAY